MIAIGMNVSIARRNDVQQTVKQEMLAPENYSCWKGFLWK